METPVLTDAQRDLIEHPFSDRIYLQGPAGSGKTTAAAYRLYSMIHHGIPANQILVLVPQRTLATQYFEIRSGSDLPAGGLVDILTLGGLAQRMIRLFWPIIAGNVGFAHPDLPPFFLNIETAQYYMARLVYPLLDEGFFDTVHIDRNRIYSQILSNLNSASASGFPYSEIGDRLINAWEGKPEQKRVYQDAQKCADLFRKFCLDHNLLDFSLSLDVFCNHLWPSLLAKQFLFRQYRHLIYENIEEDFPVAHDIVREWMLRMDSALVIHDTGGGYRSFLGADPESAASLSGQADYIYTFDQSLVTPPSLENFGASLAQSIRQQPFEVSPDACSSVRVIYRQYFTEMMDWVCREIAGLTFQQGISPGEISILAPFMTDSLRFSLANRLERFGVPSRSHRPSRALRDEPATQCLLTFAKLGHPTWGVRATPHDIRYALMLAIDGLDLTRADLLTREIFAPQKSRMGLAPFDQIKGDKQDRITFIVGEYYEKLRLWLEEYQTGEPVELDIFLSRLFGEILSQPGYGFHSHYDAATTAARLIESIQTFRWTTAEISQEQPPASIGLEYIQMVEDGVIGSQFLQGWTDQPEDAVFLAPAYTFLVGNRASTVQFWLDIGSPSWWQRLDQPLTHPYVLNRSWSPNARWTTFEEVRRNQENMARLVSGLIQRCSGMIYLCSAEINEQGTEQQGQLAVAINKILRQVPELLERGPNV